MNAIARTIKVARSVLTHSDLQELLRTNRADWGVEHLTVNEFLTILIEESILEEQRLEFRSRPITRYSHGHVSVFEVVQTINEASYFSHATAIHLNGLTGEAPRTVYLNIEQPKRPGGGQLAQDNLDRAFKGRCRESNNRANFRNLEICLVNGANTGRLGVIERKLPKTRTPIRMTDLERTLIDATVRPIYSGGVLEVARAFEAAREKLSAKRITSYLRKIGYTYPYHQSIGFYMQRAKCKQSDVELLKEFDTEFDFYLDYGLKETVYDREWRLHVPKALAKNAGKSATFRGQS